MKISVIVPIFNAERYLVRCLNSIVEQINTTHNDIEIILINDGSTDKSAEIIKKYIQKYTNNIKYIQKENTGVADSRNIGIEESTGDYIIFVDADDYIDAKLFKNLEKYMERNIDIIKYKAIIETEEEDIIGQFEGPVFEELKGEEAFSKLCYTDEMLDALWVYAYKRKIFIDNGFKFISNTYHEDFGLIPLIIIKAKTFISTDIQGYHYVQSSNSITRNIDYNKTLKKVYDTLIHYDNMLDKTKNYSINERVKEDIKIFYTNSILLRINDLKKTDRKKFIKEIRNRKMYKNIKPRNIKQLLKRIILQINIPLYLKLR